MEKIRSLGIAALLILQTVVFGQKKIIDPSVYNDWKRIGDIQISPDGLYSAYSIRPHQGDGYLFLVNNETGAKDSIARGIEPQFSNSSSFLVFRIQAGFDTIRKAELNKVPKDKWPKDSLGIWMIKNDSILKFPKLKEFKLGVESDWLAFLSASNELPKNYLSKKEAKKEAKQLKKNGPIKTDGKLLTIWSPELKKPVCYRNVQQFDIARNGAYIAFVEQQKYKKDSVRLAVHTTSNSSVWKNTKRFVEFSGMNFGFNNEQLTGLFTTDTAENKRWNLWVFDAKNSALSIIIDTNQRFETNRVLSNSYKPRFMNNGKDLFYGVWNMPDKPMKDTLLESEKVKMDLWHWKDDRMQPQQLVQLWRDKLQTNLYVHHLESKTNVQLGQDSLDLSISGTYSQTEIVASCEDQYRYQTWLSPNPANYYRISVSDGKITPLRDNTLFEIDFSPSGKYFTYWNEKTNNYYTMDVNNQIESCITCGVKANLKTDINGQPMLAGPLGIVGWATGEKGVFIQAERDLLYYDFSEKKTRSILTSLTASNPADTNYSYSLQNLVSDSVYFAPENCVLTRFDKKTRAMNVYRVNGDFPINSYTLISGSNHKYLGFKKAKKASTVLYQRHSNTDYPDVYVTGKLGADSKQISVANPQQSEYNWSTVELISWNSYDGIPLEGLVYKPENYDANKSYPLLVYYYEMYSDEIHNHYAPKPTASIIYPTEYASAGYIVLIPDIRYNKVGHPGNSAYDCIMSGTDAVMKLYPNIDAKRLGLQGQSWGGYQTAQLITMTDRYAAAMAGAPVGNMFSAYGGIRWGSGFSRQFQYEHTQSRIGKTIWEAPELYIENSPIFHLPKVKTPLLIMHNDADGAVPWYQGVELYTGLRRLQKPVWLINYNGDDHNAMKNANRMDLSIRMRQFFDYYLLGAPMPAWLQNGIPAIEKGKKNRYELLDGL